MTMLGKGEYDSYGHGQEPFRYKRVHGYDASRMHRQVVLKQRQKSFALPSIGVQKVLCGGSCSTTSRQEPKCADDVHQYREQDMDDTALRQWPCLQGKQQTTGAPLRQLTC